MIAGGESFRLLFVCHANLCRSPMAECLARHEFTARLGVQPGSVAISSAGTHALPDLPMHSFAEQVLSEHSASTYGFRSRPLTDDLLMNAHLILAADRTERSWCAVRLPTVLPRLFTIRQFGRLISVVSRPSLAARSPGARMAELVDATVTARGWPPSPTAVEDNLADPVNHPLEAFRLCAGQILQVLDVMADLLRVEKRS